MVGDILDYIKALLEGTDDSSFFSDATIEYGEGNEIVIDLPHEGRFIVTVREEE